MAFVSKFSLLAQGKQQVQREAVEGALVPLDLNGERFLQIYSLGSEDRVRKGAKSQNLRLNKAAFEQLVVVGRKHFGVNS